MKTLRYIHDILSCHRINCQQDLIRLQKSLDITQLLHQFLINVKTTGSIKQNGIISVFLCVDHCLFCCFQRFCFRTQCKNIHADALSQCLQLFNGSRTNDITGNKQRFSVPASSSSDLRSWHSQLFYRYPAVRPSSMS